MSFSCQSSSIQPLNLPWFMKLCDKQAKLVRNSPNMEVFAKFPQFPVCRLDKQEYPVCH